ncbi:MAG TPA: MBL fold metallo-hydrolase [Acidimicrobiales bacterium]|nr:MBL fold metallo-hydrolase [Acidimicrobiales bacterium]
MADDRLYFRQWLAGRDFAADDAVARQMVNFAYAIGDRATGEALLVDPAYGVGELLGALASDGMRCAGALVTHHHPDHVGGRLAGWDIEGLAALLEQVDVPVHAAAAEVGLIDAWTGIGERAIVGHDSGDRIAVGALEVELLHTPGHTPGSCCFAVDGALVSGDTLFLEGCGRTDLPGGDPGALYDSLRRLAALPASTVVFPGHRYSEEAAAPMGEVATRNVAMRPLTREQWIGLFAPS